MNKKKKYDTQPFDRFRTPPKQNLFLTPLIWLLSWIITRPNRLKIHNTRMKGLKPPFLVLGSHHSFMDFYISPLALFPYRANYISELEGFENFGEELYRQAGCLGTRKFVSDLALIKNIKKVIQRKGILVLYPEARYANVGTNSKLPESVGKLAKMLKVPVVTINMHGNYLQSPIWNVTKRKGVRFDTEVTQIFTTEELATATVEEVNEKIGAYLTYDEYAWQEKENMKISYPKRAEGLELVLYQCPNCGTEFQMNTEGADLFCIHCNNRWHMNELGKLEPISPSEDPSPIHIPHWYEWQRQQVIKEIDSHTYHLELPVKIDSLPNGKNFIPLGDGVLKHNQNGFWLTFTPYESEQSETLHCSPASMSSIHTEYDYRGQGQCVTLSTLDNTYFLFPKGEGFNATKIQFATEYLYEISKK